MRTIATYTLEGLSGAPDTIASVEMCVIRRPEGGSQTVFKVIASGEMAADIYEYAGVVGAAVLARHPYVRAGATPPRFLFAVSGRWREVFYDSLTPVLAVGPVGRVSFLSGVEDRAVSAGEYLQIVRESRQGAENRSGAPYSRHMERPSVRVPGEAKGV